MASKQGILDLSAHDYGMVFGTQVNLNLSKAERLIYGDSCMNHAMVLTGVHVVEVRLNMQKVTQLTPIYQIYIAIQEIHLMLQSLE